MGNRPKRSERVPNITCVTWPKKKQEMIFARLQPAGELEERLARQIVLCNYKLEQIQHRLTKAWCQLNKIYEELKPETLS